MASTINAITTGAGGIVTTGDSTGVIGLQSNGTTAVTVNAYGIGLGTAVPSSGIGISFPATQSASSDANTLDDYEEGTWTPNFATTGTAPSLTYADRDGIYIKIGKLVFISMHIEANVVSSVGTGTLNITGLPFTSAAGGGAYYEAISVGYQANWAASQTAIGAMVFNGVTYIRPYYQTSISSGYIDSTASGLGNNLSCYIAGCYYAAS
jgi:hypothetical protein